MSGSLIQRIEDFAQNKSFTLPVFGEAAIRVRNALRSDDYDIVEVERIIQTDQALSVEVLKAANSPFYGGLTAITSVRNAVVRIGAKQVTQLVLMASSKSQYKARDVALALMIADLWKHAAGTAMAAQWLSRRLGFTQLEDEAFVGGLLHDIGKLYLLRVLDELMADANNPIDAPRELIDEILASTHAEQGHRLLASWNLPEIYRLVVRDHHRPDFDPANFTLLVVRLANAACAKLGIGLSAEQGLVLPALPEAQHLGAGELLLAELEIVLEDSILQTAGA